MPMTIMRHDINKKFFSTFLKTTRVSKKLSTNVAPKKNVIKGSLITTMVKTPS